MGLADDKGNAFAKVWNASAPALLEKLKEKSVSATRLDNMQWRLNLQMSNTSLSRINTTSAVFSFALSGADEESFLVEFTKDELYELFYKLEEIQDQLDSLQ